jgi:hypothetical protein
MSTHGRLRGSNALGAVRMHSALWMQRAANH